MQWCHWKQHWHPRDMFRHCLDMQKHLNMPRHINIGKTCRYCLHSSTHCLDTLIILLENGLERKKMDVSCNGLERYFSVSCTKSV